MEFMTVIQIVKMLIIVITFFNIYLIQSSYGSGTYSDPEYSDDTNYWFHGPNNEAPGTSGTNKADIDNEALGTSGTNKADIGTYSDPEYSDDTNYWLNGINNQSTSDSDYIDIQSDPRKLEKCAINLKSKFNNCTNTLDCLLFIYDNEIKLKFKNYKNKDYWNFITDLGDKVFLKTLNTPSTFCTSADPSNYPIDVIISERQLDPKIKWKAYIKELCINKLEEIIKLEPFTPKLMFNFVYQNYVSSGFPKGTFVHGYFVYVLSRAKKIKKDAFNKHEIDHWCRTKYPK